MADLTDEQLQQIETHLARRAVQLEAEVRAAKQAAAEQESVPGRDVRDAVEDGDERLLSGLDHVQLLRDQEELRDIADARERIRTGRYGDCVKCGEPIGLARLKVQPTARFCLEHQAEWERTHGAAPPFTT
ncbi:MAG TPA: TraR/DksA family transcriptional regulator [Burkholderiaceae bacterium]|nr:TraR/DksA family transcriptional regulator [Burkholderiaceae bacterium]